MPKWHPDGGTNGFPWPGARIRTATAIAVASLAVGAAPVLSSPFDGSMIQSLLPEEPPAADAADAETALPVSLSAAGVVSPNTCTGVMLGDASQPAKPVRVSPESFRPVLVERIAPEATDTATAAPGGANDLLSAMADLDPNALRVLATMSPDQIDALTLLVLSRQGGGPGAAAGALSGTGSGATQASGTLPQDAPWVGEWSDEEIATAESGGEAPQDEAPGVPPQGLPGWQLMENSNGTLVLFNPDDPVTSLTVEPGMVIGNHGRVEDVVRGPGEVLVFLDSGLVLSGTPNPAVVFRPSARPSAVKVQYHMAAGGLYRSKANRLSGLTIAPPVPEGDAIVQTPEPAPIPPGAVMAAAPADAAESRVDGAPPPRPPLATAAVIPSPDWAQEEPADALDGLIEAGVFATEASATEVSQELVDFEMFPVVVMEERGGRTLFRVLVDTYKTPIPPERVASRLAEMGYGPSAGIGQPPAN